MKFSKKIAAVALLAMSLLITGCGQAKIGCVDGNKVMTDAPQIKTVMDEAQQKLQEAQKEIEAEAAKNPNMSQEEMMRIQMDAQRKLAGIQQSYATQAKYKLDEVLSGIVKEKGLDVVVDNSENNLIFKGGIDITDEVIKKLQ